MQSKCNTLARATNKTTKTICGDRYRQNKIKMEENMKRKTTNSNEQQI